ncbi:single-stranded DNA-binding protein [Lichenihabitans psoromatis]|uniref:single-stranded DNA-binding protein n=1 Tax=Lichenihabitans psoromatis TaxID=2528642 RepID=UPI001036C41F|nr:single-stranded DNA-binding protein [Lichenihabitans psoromatis]
MAGSVNKVTLIGNLGKDPQVRRMNSGEAVVNLTIATSETWRDKASGERKEKTEWHNVVIFNENIAKVAEQYLKKGSKVYVEGQLQTRKWTDKDGAEKYTTEVVLQRYRGELTLLDSRGSGGDFGGREEGGSFERPSGGGGSGSSYGRSASDQRSSSGPSNTGGGRLSETIDDDIPF